MDAKVTFFFEAAQQAQIGTDADLGWTENWYRGGSGSFDETFASPDVQKYIQLRRQCLPQIYRMSFVRISDILNPRSFKVFSLNSQLGAIPPNQAAQVQCSILVDMEAAVVGPPARAVHRKFLMRGLDRRVISGNVIDQGAPTWNRYTAFLNFIAGHDATVARDPAIPHATSLGMQYQQGGVKQRIFDLQTLPLAPTSFKTVPDLAGVTEGDRVRISGIPDLPALNRIWKVILQLPGVSTRFGKSKRPLPRGYSMPADATVFARLAIYAYTPLAQYTIVGLANKKTGRVFRHLRGRR